MVTVKQTPQAEAILTDFIKETNLKLAIETKDMSKKFCPVRTGALQESIVIQEASSGDLIVGSTLPYAGAVEFGTRFQSPQPFMAQGLEQAIQNMQ